jgi:uncharacterized BrkB/YihY/UPF0761 family membrane protein
VEPQPPEPSRRARAITGAKARAERLQARADAERKRHRSVDVVFDAVDRDGEIGGGILAGALAYRFFIWLLPLALVLVAGLGLAASAADESPVESAKGLGLGGLVSGSIAQAAKSSNRWYALVIGIPILLWVTRSLLRALITVHRLVWGEGRGTAPKPTPAATLRLLALLLGYLVVSTLMRAVQVHSTVGGLLFTLLDWSVFAGLWLLIELQMPHRGTPWRALVPGAILFGVGIQLLGAVTSYLIVPWAEGKQGTYGALGLAAALLLGLFLISRLMVATAVLNATLWERRTRAT